jgi:hypothetical protein
MRCVSKSGRTGRRGDRLCVSQRPITNPGFCEGGRGEVVSSRATQRVVQVTTDRKKGYGGKNPAISLGRAFVEAYRR